jgi:hypothetical protein
MRTVVIRATRPWSQLNEYEGELDIELDGVTLTGRAVLAGAHAWNEIVLGATVDVDVWLECLADVEILAAPAALALVSLGGASYEAVGRVLSAEGDEVLLATRIELRVDLASTPVQPQSVVQAGDLIRVTGQLQIDLTPERPEAPEGSS